MYVDINSYNKRIQWNSVQKYKRDIIRMNLFIDHQARLMSLSLGISLTTTDSITMMETQGILQLKSLTVRLQIITIYHLVNILILLFNLVVMRGNRIIIKNTKRLIGELIIIRRRTGNTLMIKKLRSLSILVSKTQSKKSTKKKNNQN